MVVRPDYNEIKRLAKEYDIVPVCREIYADITTPIAILRRISQNSSRHFLLESIEGGEKWGRYSFLGYDPVGRVTCRKGEVIIENHGTKTLYSARPFEVLREFLSRHRAPVLEGLPPFAGGLVGYFSYNMFGYAEPVLKIKESEFYDFDLMLYDKVIAYDHLKQKISIVVNMRTDNTEENYKKALDDIKNIIGMIYSNAIPDVPAPASAAAVPSASPGAGYAPVFTCNVSKDEYCGMVEKTKEYIRNGDAFQVVISRRFEAEYKDSLLNAYRVLRTTNPSPYMVFMTNDDVQLICSSPETLVRLHNGVLSTFPIGGSRPRGKNASEDQELEKELMADEKEHAEHDMLVDLARNDLGKISKFNSVRVVKYKTVQRYSRVMHITSEAEGLISEDKDALDAIEALLPAGTMSGAPKIRACEIIEELEKVPRGIYSGAIGYIDFTGNMDVCIAIRMAVRKNDRVYIQAGGGIVADSIAYKEYEESGHKARAVMEAIISAGEVDR